MIFAPAVHPSAAALGLAVHDPDHRAVSGVLDRDPPRSSRRPTGTRRRRSGCPDDPDPHSTTSRSCGRRSCSTGDAVSASTPKIGDVSEQSGDRIRRGDRLGRRLPDQVRVAVDLGLGHRLDTLDHAVDCAWLHGGDRHRLAIAIRRQRHAPSADPLGSHVPAGIAIADAVRHRCSARPESRPDRQLRGASSWPSTRRSPCRSPPGC